MKNKILIISTTIFIVFSIFICIYPHIEFYYNNNLYMMSYHKDWIESEDLKELEQQMCYNESYSYNKKRNISIKNWEYNNFLFFYWFKINYQKGNICATEFLLEESYIERFLEKAIIKNNENKIDLAKLIEGKKAIVSNKRYPWKDDNNYIEYTLDGENKEMFVSISKDGLIIIQVGSTDESPKYIAYK